MIKEKSKRQLARQMDLKTLSMVKGNFEEYRMENQLLRQDESQVFQMLNQEGCKRDSWQDRYSLWSLKDQRSARGKLGFPGTSGLMQRRAEATRKSLL